MKTADDGNGERRRTSWDKVEINISERYPERFTRDDEENPENPTHSTPYDPPW
jgi:hypothetical protein